MLVPLTGTWILMHSRILHIELWKTQALLSNKNGTRSSGGRTRIFPESASEKDWLKIATFTTPIAGQHSLKDAPNANEFLHYVFNGYYHWDGKAPF